MKKVGKILLATLVPLVGILIILFVPCWNYCTKEQTCGETNQSCHRWKPYCKKNVPCPTGQMCSRGRCIADDRRFGCNDNGECIEDSQGQWTSQDDCKCFSCNSSSGKCQAVKDGDFHTQGECNKKCHTRTWMCGNQGVCIEVQDGTGPYLSADACECFDCTDGQCSPVKPGQQGHFKDGQCEQNCTQFLCNGDGTCKRVSRGTKGAQDECTCFVCNSGVCSPVSVGEAGQYGSLQECRQDPKCHSQTLSWACDPGTGTCSQSTNGPFNSKEDCKCFNCSTDATATGACVPTQEKAGTMTLSDCKESTCAWKFGCNGDGTCSKAKDGYWTNKDSCKCIGCSSNSCQPVGSGEQGTFASLQDCKASDCDWLYGCSDLGECVKMKDGHWSSPAGCKCWKCVGEQGPSSSCQLVSRGEIGHFDSKLECQRDGDAKCGWQYAC